MVAYFPNPYPDEILYSLMARYAQHTNSTRSQLGRDLFGVKTVTSNFHMPNKLDAVASNISEVSELTTERLLMHHTLYPFYSAFGTIKRANRMREFLLKGGERFVVNRIEGLELGVFRYCSRCVKEDRDKFGEAFWHRCHNLPSMITCTQHGVKLKKFVAKALSIPYEFLSAEAVLENCDDAVIATQLEISEDSVVQDILLQNTVVDFKKISQTAIDKGFVRVSGDKTFPLINDRIRSYVEQNHARFSHLVAKKNMDWRLPMILKGNADGTQPWLCLLVKEFVETQPGVVKDFNVKCHNKTCLGFDAHLSPGSWSITTKVQNSFAYIATCPQCGHKYKGSSTSKRIISLDLGDSVKEKIKTNLKSKSRRQIIRDFGLGRDFINKIMNGETVRMPIPKKHLPNRKLKEEYRGIWLEALQSGRFKGVQEMIDVMSKVQCWLYRNDREWVLSMNAKYLKKNPRASLKSFERDDVTDERVLSELQLFVSNFELDKNRFRLSKSLILANVRGIKSLDLKRLPKSFSFLKLHEESHSDYVKRKTRIFEGHKMFR